MGQKKMINQKKRTQNQKKWMLRPLRRERRTHQKTKMKKGQTQKWRKKPKKTEKKKKSRFTEVSFTSNLKSNDSKQIFEDFYALEGKMCYKDKLVRETVSTKNTLESLIYTSRDKLTY